MKPTMAVTLTVEKINSASPYPLIPKRLIKAIKTRNIDTKMALLKCSFQYCTVNAPAISSSGRANSH